MFIDQKKLHEMLRSEELEALESDIEIEDLILLIRSIDEKVEFTKRLKKARVKALDEELSKLDERKQAFREIIGKTLNKFGHKSLNFPGIGRVSVKPGKSKWVVKEESDLLKYLSEKLDSDEYQTVINQKVSILKKELDKILDKWENQNEEIPESINKELGSDTVTIVADKKGENLREKSQQIEQEADLDNERQEENYDELGEVNF